MKKNILLAIFIIATLTVFCLAETTGPRNITNEWIILRAVLPHYVEPLSRIVNPPTMWEILVGFGLEGSPTEHLQEVSCYYSLYKNGNIIDCFNWDRTNLYPNTPLIVEESAGLHPGGNTYSANATLRLYYPGSHIPYLEVGRTKTIAPLDLNN